jgi:hypothetical protein
MAEKNYDKKGEKLPQIPEQRSEMIQLSDDVLDEVAAGGNGLTVDYYEEGYCPYCEGYHEIVQCQEQVRYNGSWFDMSYCPIKRHYFFEAGNRYFDWNGNMIWGWQ